MGTSLTSMNDSSAFPWKDAFRRHDIPLPFAADRHRSPGEPGFTDLQQLVLQSPALLWTPLAVAIGMAHEHREA